MAQLITLKNAIKKGLRKRGLEVIHQLDEATGDDGSDDIVRISKYMFDEIDTDGSGHLSYQELKIGLRSFGIYVVAKEFQLMVEFIDPDQSNDIGLDEWLDFLQASDDAIEQDEWREFKAVLAIRRRIKSELVHAVMSVPPTEAEHVFKQLDADGSESLDADELRTLCRMMGARLSEGDVAAMMHDMDTDKSGSVEFGEFSVWWEKHRLEKEGPTPLRRFPKKRARGGVLPTHVQRAAA